MNCVNFCCSLILLTICASVFADDCDDLLNDDCEDSYVMNFFVAAMECYGDNTTCIKGKETSSPKCASCLKTNVLGNEDPFCKCLNMKSGVNEEALKDQATFDTAGGLALQTLVNGKCGENIKKLQEQYAPKSEAS